MKKRVLGNCMLFLAAMIWGAAFVAQTVGMDYVEPFTFQASRSLLGSLILLPVIAVLDKRGNDKKPVTKADKNYLLLSGLVCGLFLFTACSLQQLGLQYTTAGKSGFLTSLYIILVPLLGLFLKKKVRPWIWISVVLAACGLYLLCGGGAFSLGKGELLTLGCAAAFSFHILAIDHVSAKVDGVRLSSIQFFVCAVLSAVVMCMTESPSWEAVKQCWLPIAYAGVLSSGVGYTFQIIGQAHTEPTVASLLMSLESVFSVVFGWLLLHQALSAPELLGCALVFGGVVLAQLPGNKVSVQ